MERTAVNPWDWSQKMGFHQGEIITGGTRLLNVAGQTACDETGAPQCAGDMRGQIALALDNLEAVIAGADMTLGQITKLGIYTTDIEEALKNFDLMGMRFGPHGVKPPMTLLGVSQLALPDLMFEIEATAVA